MKKLPDDPMDMDQIYRTYERMVYQFLYMRTHDAHWSQDLLQETFLRAVTSISRYDGSCKLSVWLCQIARHVLWQELRKRGIHHLKVVYSTELPTSPLRSADYEPPQTTETRPGSTARSA